MSQRISVKGIILSDLAKNFGSKNEKTLCRVAELIQRQGGGALLDSGITSMPEGCIDYDYDFLVAARDIIMGVVKPGDSLPYESQAVVNAVCILAGLQDLPWAEMKYNGDWKNYAIDAYSEEIAQRVDPTIKKMLSYLSEGRPFFSLTFCTSENIIPDEYYSYLTYQEMQELAEYMRSHPFMILDSDGFGADFLSGVESLITGKKDLWFTVF